MYCRVQWSAGALVGVLISVLIGAVGLGGCIVDRGEEHSSVLLQPMPVRHNYSLLNLIIPAETGDLDHLQTSIFSCLKLVVQHDLCLISDKHCAFIIFCWVLCSGVMISSTKNSTLTFKTNYGPWLKWQPSFVPNLL